MIRDGDAVLFFNFRPDRARQLTEKLTGELDLSFATLTQYREEWTLPVAFPPARPGVTMATVLADRGLAQLHVAETEKYAHVTYFFNGGEESEYDGEERRLVDSPRDVATYDEKPEMSARAAADAFVEQWGAGDYGFGVINFANADMVGHTGVIEAAVKAIETVDGCLGDVVEAVNAKGGVCLVTADHGNADHMLEPDGSPNTAHSLNPVPLVVTADVGELRDDGILADVVPTALALLGQDQPEEMTGKDLIRRRLRFYIHGSGIVPDPSGGTAMSLLIKPEPFSREVDRLFDRLFDAPAQAQRWAPADGPGRGRGPLRAEGRPPRRAARRT